MRIVIGADHRGFELKYDLQQSVSTINDQPITWIDVGTHDAQRVDYPRYAKAAIECLRSGEALYGVLLCATGIGMAIAANRSRGIYAALVWNEEVARLSRQHDHANVVVLPTDFIDREQAVRIVQVWLTTQPLGGVYSRRVAMIDAQE